MASTRTGTSSSAQLRPPPGRLWPKACAVVVLACICVSCATGTDTESAGQPAGHLLDWAPAPAPHNRPSDIPEPWAAGDSRLGGLGFTEVAAGAGLDAPHSELSLVAQQAMTSGAALADVDRDGDIDVFLPRVGRPNSLYINDGTGRFTDVAQEAGLAGPEERFGSSAAAFADFDADGNLDLFVAGAGFGANRLYMNNGDGTFSDQARTRGLVWPDPRLAEEGTQIHDVAAADVNLDGHMDLLVLQWFHPLYGDAGDEAIRAAFDLPGGTVGESPSACEAAHVLRGAGWPLDSETERNRSALFLNDGSGHFRDATDDLELPLKEIVAFTGVFNDLNGDGWPDLTITGDGCTSRLFENVGGERFEDHTPNSGTATDENAMGSVVTDINRDGRADWFVTSISYPSETDTCPVTGFAVGCSGNRLYLNTGDFTFQDATDDYGLRDSGWGWGAVVEDLDNDGRDEVAANNGYLPAPTPEGASTSEPAAEVVYYDSFVNDPTRLWVWDDEAGTYRDAAMAVGLDDRTVGHALAAFDMDGDGDLDLLSVPVNEPPLLFRNDTPAGAAWLEVALDDPAHPGNAEGVGARIEVTPNEGDAPRVAWIGTDGSYETQSPARAHFGLGDAGEGATTEVHRLEVFWPGENEPQVVNDVPTNQHLVVVRDET